MSFGCLWCRCVRYFATGFYSYLETNPDIRLPSTDSIQRANILNFDLPPYSWKKSWVTNTNDKNFLFHFTDRNSIQCGCLENMQRKMHFEISHSVIVVVVLYIFSYFYYLTGLCTTKGKSAVFHRVCGKKGFVFHNAYQVLHALLGICGMGVTMLDEKSFTEEVFHL